jgi:hydrogenase small subunit
VSELALHLSARGVSRRDFIAYCGVLSASLGLGALAAPRVAAALEQAARLKPAVWLNLGSCTGCTESVAQADTPDIADIVLSIISLDYAETLAAAAGMQAESALARTVSARGHIVIVEGSVMTGEQGNTLRIGGRPGTEILETVCADAELIIAVGSCAFDGGWVKAAPDPAGAKGVLDHMPAVRSRLVNLPTCPVNPEWVVGVLVRYLLEGTLPPLDDRRRPTGLFSQTIHDNCPRRGHFANGEFVERFGGLEERLGWCLYKVGCKGPTTGAACPLTRWNRRVSWCVESGSPCIGCASPEWVDANTPFLARTGAVTPGIGGIKPENVAQIVAAGAAGAFAAWGVAETARGRLHDGESAGPTESDVSLE